MKYLIYIFSIALIYGCVYSDGQQNNIKGRLETKLMRGGNIWSLDWSQDGKNIACGNASGLIRIYDVENRKLSNILTGFNATINGIHFSPDGKKIVASGGNEDPRIIIWDLEQKTNIIINDHQRQVRTVRWSPKGDHFASSSHDGTIRIWTSEGKYVKKFSGANGGCVGIDWLNEDVIAASCWDNTIRTYTISSTDSLLIENGNHRRKAVLSIDWHPNGQLIATGDYGNEEDTVHSVKIWSNKGTLIEEMNSHLKEIRSLSWNKNGEILATGGETVRFWNKHGELLSICAENTSPVWSLDWNPDGTEVASGHNDGKVRFWSTKGELIDIIDGHSSRLMSRSYNEDSTNVFLGFSDGSLRYIDVNQLSSITLIAHNRSITNIQRSHDKQMIALSSNDGSCSIWNLIGDTLVKRASFGNSIFVRSMEWDMHDKHIALLQSDSKISVWTTDGKFQYEQEVIDKNANILKWNNLKPTGTLSTERNSNNLKVIYIQKDKVKLELVPLNNNRFALIDSLNTIVHGSKNDFIDVVKEENGFVKLLSL